MNNNNERMTYWRYEYLVFNSFHNGWFDYWKERVKDLAEWRGKRNIKINTWLILHDVIEKVTKENTWAKEILLGITDSHMKWFVIWERRTACIYEVPLSQTNTHSWSILRIHRNNQHNKTDNQKFQRLYW